ncbi:MAG: hypothetical protein KDC42_07710 [Ignavibacteriae bacterium]|nr:hypothetical protein [Ignavibacteriota bacterium]
MFSISKVYVFVVILFLLPVHSNANDKYCLVDKLERLDIYSSYWLNMHHFLYQTADKSSLYKFNTWKIDSTIINQLPETDRTILNNTLDYYSDNMIMRHLLFSDTMYAIKNWLITLPCDENLPDTFFVDGFTEILNSFDPVYRKYFWETHNKINTDRWNKQSEIIKSIEPALIDEISKYAKKDFPDRIRVDLTAYSNSLGGYTTEVPPHVILSSDYIYTQGTQWIELIFHEASHTIMSTEGEINKELVRISAELDKKLPGQYWHAIQFYLVGRIVQKILASKGIEHEIFMFENDVFTRYLKKYFTNNLDLYLDGSLTLEKALKNIIKETDFH